MHRPGHYGAALIAYAPVAFVTTAAGFLELALVGGVGVVMLAMLPDFDQRVPFVRHRGPTHTVWFMLAVAVVLAVGGTLFGASDGVVNAVGLGVFGFAVGVVSIGSHIAADALIPAGVRPFAPVRPRRYTFELAKASNPVANYALLAIGAVAALVAVGAGNAIAAAF